MKKPFSARRLSFIALGSALITVCAWISVPAAVPFTLQTFAVFTVTCVLGWRDAALSALVYLFLGGVGVPVFSGFSGGPGALFGATGGYLLGFIAIPLLRAPAGKNARLPMEALALIAGLAVCYAFGTAWFVRVYSRQSAITVSKALSLCVVPFILPDLMKLTLSLAVGRRVREALRLAAA